MSHLKWGQNSNPLKCNITEQNHHFHLFKINDTSFNKIYSLFSEIWKFLLAPAHPGGPGQRAVKQFVCVCCLLKMSKLPVASRVDGLGDQLTSKKWKHENVTITKCIELSTRLASRPKLCPLSWPHNIGLGLTGLIPASTLTIQPRLWPCCFDWEGFNPQNPSPIWPIMCLVGQMTQPTVSKHWRK